MQPVLTAAQSRAFDRYLIDDLGIPSIVLMEHAALAAIRAMEDWLNPQANVVILVGPGNNGGDGLAIGRLLLERGIEPKILLIADPEKLSGDARHQYDILAKILAPARIRIIDRAEAEAGRIDAADFFADRPDIIVDALLGTGSTGELRGTIKAVVTALRTYQASCPLVRVLAVDIPTGLDSDRGMNLPHGHIPYLRADPDSIAQEPVIVRAERTVTMGAPKIGFYQGHSRCFTGVVSIARLGAPYPQRMFEVSPGAYLVSADDAASIEPFLYTASKFDRGRILALCGSLGMSGAAVMAATAALKSGAGYVTVGGPHSIRSTIAQVVPELVTIGISEDVDGNPSSNAWYDIQDQIETSDVILIGCGYRAVDTVGSFVRKVVAEVNKPMIIDGGALRAIAGYPEILQARSSATVLTPNVGELAALIDQPRETVSQSFLECAREIATTCNAVVVAKAVPELIVDRDGTLYINSTGNPGMGTAGTGDVLAGILAARLARIPTDPCRASVQAVYLSGLAGDLAARDRTTHSMTATDVIEYLPYAFKQLGVQ